MVYTKEVKLLCHQTALVQIIFGEGVFGLLSTTLAEYLSGSCIDKRRPVSLGAPDCFGFVIKGIADSTSGWI